MSSTLRYVHYPYACGGMMLAGFSPNSDPTIGIEAGKKKREPVDSFQALKTIIRSMLGGNAIPTNSADLILNGFLDDPSFDNEDAEEQTYVAQQQIDQDSQFQTEYRTDGYPAMSQQQTYYQTTSPSPVSEVNADGSYAYYGYPSNGYYPTTTTSNNNSGYRTPSPINTPYPVTVSPTSVTQSSPYYSTASPASQSSSSSSSVPRPYPVGYAPHWDTEANAARTSPVNAAPTQSYSQPPVVAVAIPSSHQLHYPTVGAPAYPTSDVYVSVPASQTMPLPSPISPVSPVSPITPVGTLSSSFDKSPASTPAANSRPTVSGPARARDPNSKITSNSFDYFGRFTPTDVEGADVAAGIPEKAIIDVDAEESSDDEDEANEDGSDSVSVVSSSQNLSCTLSEEGRQSSALELGTDHKHLHMEPGCCHIEEWKRLRAKRGFGYYVCQSCGAKWKSASSVPTTRPTARLV